MTAKTEVGPGTSGIFGRWGRRQSRNASWRRQHWLGVYLVPTMCKRERSDLCHAGTYYLAGERRSGHKSHYKVIYIEGAICLLEMGQLRAV